MQTWQKEVTRITKASRHTMFVAGHARADAGPGALGES